MKKTGFIILLFASFFAKSQTTEVLNGLYSDGKTFGKKIPHTVYTLPYSQLQYWTGYGTFGSLRDSAVASISLTTPNVIFSTPVTFSNTAGAWSGSLSLNSQSANKVFASPSGSSGTPTFRSLATADISDAYTTQTLTDGATVTFDASLGRSAMVTIAGNRTLSITNFSNGQFLSLLVIQDGTGSRTLTLPSCKVINGGSGAVTLSTAASSQDILTFWKINNIIYCNYGKNYN